MCVAFISVNEDPNERPEVALAKEFEKNLGAKMDPVALRLFLLHRWSRVTVLAHAIHDDGEKQ